MNVIKLLNMFMVTDAIVFFFYQELFVNVVNHCFAFQYNITVVQFKGVKGFCSNSSCEIDLFFKKQNLVIAKILK